MADTFLKLVDEFLQLVRPATPTNITAGLLFILSMVGLLSLPLIVSIHERNARHLLVYPAILFAGMAVKGCSVEAAERAEPVGNLCDSGGGES